jgi:predicted small lipoprotein YifL
MKRVLLLAPLALLLAACGQKGALYLPAPDEGPVVISPAPEAVPEPAPPPASEPDRSDEPRKRAH